MYGDMTDDSLASIDNAWKCVITVQEKNKHQFSCYLIPLVLLLWISSKRNMIHASSFSCYRQSLIGISNRDWRELRRILFFYLSIEARHFTTFEFNHRLFKWKYLQFFTYKNTSNCLWHPLCPITKKKHRTTNMFPTKFNNPMYNWNAYCVLVTGFGSCLNKYWKF